MDHAARVRLNARCPKGGDYTSRIERPRDIKKLSLAFRVRNSKKVRQFAPPPSDCLTVPYLQQIPEIIFLEHLTAKVEVTKA